VALSIPDGAPATGPAGKPADGTLLDRLLPLAHAAPDLRVGTLTIRVPDAHAGPVAEVLDREVSDLRRRAIRVTVPGRRAEFSADLRRAVGTAERATAAGRRLHLRLAIGASSRDSIVAAFQGWDDRPPRTRAEVTWILGADGPPAAPVPDVDVLVLVGGAARLCDFLLWECARAEVRVVGADWRSLRPSHLGAALGTAGRRTPKSRRALAAGARP